MHSSISSISQLKKLQTQSKITVVMFGHFPFYRMCPY